MSKVSWFASSKKIPRKGQRVLVTWQTGKKRHVDWDVYQGSGEWFFEYMRAKPTHWAAFPPPPTTDGKP